MDEQMQLLKSIREALEVNNAKIEALEQRMDTKFESLEESIKQEFQEVKDRLDDLETGQTLLVQKIFQTEKDVERMKRVK